MGQETAGLISAYCGSSMTRGVLDEISLSLGNDDLVESLLGDLRAVLGLPQD